MSLTSLNFTTTNVQNTAPTSLFYTFLGQPDRSYLWIMFRTPHYDQELYATVEQKCIDEWGYKKEDIVIVPHNWDDDQLLITDPADFEL